MGSDTGKHPGEQPDLLIELYQPVPRKIIADVVIVNCQAPSHIMTTWWNALEVLDTAEYNKHTKYGHLAAPNQAQVTGMAFDALGGYGDCADEIVTALCT